MVLQVSPLSFQVWEVDTCDDFRAFIFGGTTLIGIALSFYLLFSREYHILTLEYIAEMALNTGTSEFLGLFCRLLYKLSGSSVELSEVPRLSFHEMVPLVLKWNCGQNFRLVVSLYHCVVAFLCFVVSRCRFVVLEVYPYQRKSMGMIWQNMGHIWPISGNGMGRLGEDMELIWGSILPHFNVWKMYGKKSWCYPLHGKAMGTQFPYKSHSSDTFACSMSSMGMIQYVHCSIFHRFAISANIIFSSPIDSPMIIL